jgi:predicted dehydrogenase
LTKLKVGIIGTGFGALVQAPGFMLHPECEVVALSGVTRPGRAAEEAAKLSIPRSYDDYRTMFAEEELDLVSVASAPYMHHEMTLAALSRRIPVLCEKPMALNLAEARAMAEAAEREGVIGAIDFEFRHQPARTKFKQLMAEGFLGELTHFNLTYTTAGFERNLGRPIGWLWRQETGGGMLGALGSHVVDTVRWLFGDILQVAGFVNVHVDQRSGRPADGDDSFAFLAKLAGKATGLVQYHMHAHHGEGLRLEAFGTKGSIILTDDMHLLAGRAGEPMSEVVLPPRFKVEGIAYSERLDARLPGFLVLVDNLVDALRGTRRPGPSRDYATFRDGVAVQAILDAVRRSHADGRWVTVDA